MTARTHALMGRLGARGTVLYAVCAAIALCALRVVPVGAASREAATPVPGLPDELLEVAFDQKIGDPVPLDLRFRDESGAEVPLAHFFGTRPVVLSLVYYECPMLCSMALNGLTRSLRVVDLGIGSDFDVLTVSFDPDDTPELARAKKESYVRQLGEPSAAEGWHFLTGDPSAIDALTSAVGFRYVYDEDSGQYAHAAGVVVLTPDGVIARYFFGIEYAAKDLRLGVVEASKGTVGSVVDQVLLYCFQYDPTTGTYSAVVLRIVRLAGIVSLLAFALLFWILRRRERSAPSGDALPHAPGGGT